jgi:putative ABC transport system ATP-binding protein
MIIMIAQDINAPLYQLAGVTRTYPKGRKTVTAVRELDLTVNRGDWLVVQGRTGHGKTTLLQILGLLDRPTAGSVAFNGHEVTGQREGKLTRIRARHIGFVFQTFNLIPTLTAAQNVQAALVPLGLDPRQRRSRVLEALDSVGLADRARHLPSELSGGQQQRVGIARALAKAPDVLLADEPTGNLDESTRDEIVDLLEATWRGRGLTLVMVTHDSTIARRAPRVGVMTKGVLTMRRDRSQ